MLFTHIRWWGKNTVICRRWWRHAGAKVVTVIVMHGNHWPQSRRMKW